MRNKQTHSNIIHYSEKDNKCHNLLCSRWKKNEYSREGVYMYMRMGIHLYMHMCICVIECIPPLLLMMPQRDRSLSWLARPIRIMLLMSQCRIHDGESLSTWADILPILVFDKRWPWHCATCCRKASSEKLDHDIWRRGECSYQVPLHNALRQLTWIRLDTCSFAYVSATMPSRHISRSGEAHAV